MATRKQPSRPKSRNQSFNLPAIAALIEDGGDITIGPIAGIPCVATATGWDQCLAMLVRRDNESFVHFLLRLDAVIANFDRTGLVDEVNPPNLPVKQIRASSSRR